VAKAIHYTSHRQDGPLVTVNCSAMPETLLESELFGYKAGAFTDARRDKPGRIAAAEGGTLFLDEIGDIPLSIQMKLLRVIQEKVYEPLGGTKSVKADVRILSATNRNLEKLVEEERFRMDLYYRINVVRLELPPLAERSEDVPLLVNHFIARFSTIKGKDIDGIAPEAMNILLRHDYPGNVRELENIIEHAFVLCPGGMILVCHLPEYLQFRDAPSGGGALGLLRQYEKQLILGVLRRNGWNRSEAARELGIHKTTLFRKVRKLGIRLPDRDGRSKR
jgi:transcriptional regulator with PAS, ATPase and Fis domain